MIVEVRDLEGHLRERRRVAVFPVSVGRGYPTDIILDDPYVCPSHLRIEPREGLLGGAVDVGSVNGVYSWPDEVKLPHVDIRSNSRVRIGDTVLVFIDENESVGPTIMRARGTVRRERTNVLPMLRPHRIDVRSEKAARPVAAADPGSSGSLRRRPCIR